MGNDLNTSFVLRGGGGPAPTGGHLKAVRHPIRSCEMRYALSVPILAFVSLLSGQSLAADTDWSKVDAALGKTASVQGEVHRYGIPRSDLQVTVVLMCRRSQS